MPSPVDPRAPAPPAAAPRTVPARPPGPTMTERCSLWSALSAAACCFYRGSFVQVQVRGRLGPRRALRAGTPGRSGTGGGDAAAGAEQGPAWQGLRGREGAGSPQSHLWAPGRSVG